VPFDPNQQALGADGKDTPDFDAASLDAPGVAVARAGAPRLPAWLYAGSIFLSAFLLFQVQPILAKLILPWFGGAAAVWVISLAFYQLTYLLGNLYAHILIQRSGPRFSTRAHALLLLASLLLLPIVPSAVWQPRGSEEPMWRILGVLAATVGVPFLLLSATSSLVQAWHTLGREDARPYRFYALSNAASLLALLSYPVVVEPLVSTHHQALIWSAGYGVFAALCSLFAFRPPVPKLPPNAHPATEPQQPPLDERPRWRLQLLWLGLAASASALLLSITHYVSQNIAAIPLLWVVPLSLYLLTLILCFEGERWYSRRLFLPLLPIVLAGMGYALSPKFEGAGPGLQIPLYFAGLFICCMVCHGEMAALKPRPEFLTVFYLMVSAGGALGGMFVALAAPYIFRGFYELPLALGACAVVVLNVLLPKPQRSARSVRGRGRAALWMAKGLTVLFLALLFYVVRQQNKQALVMVRNFYGVLRVSIVPPSGLRPAVTQLRNGTVVHGDEILDEARKDVPTTYYGQQSGVGIALLFARQAGNIRVGVIGLGIGTLARYGQKGDHYFFYEINPQVVDLANELFDFLGRSEAQVDIIPGDGRLSLARQSPQSFDVLVVDAFSGDAIPVHLLTREAFELYLRHLKPRGVLAIHVSNRLLDLPPVVESGARSVGARAIEVTNAENDASAVYESEWMLLDRDATPNPTVSALAESRVALPPGTSSQNEDKNRVLRPWTDDYSNLVEILR
jgi:SAM-dependent methyltransferase